MKKKYKIGICGSFGGANATYDGQTVKTRNLFEAIKQKTGEGNISAVNSHFWRRKPLSTFVKCIALAKNCEKIIILPAQRGLKVFLPMYSALKKIFGIEVYYAVVGGWLPQAAEKDRNVFKCLKYIDGIYVETSSMRTALNNLGMKNVKILPNFKMIEPLKKSELIYQTGYPLKLCTFSRVMEQKGIGEAVRAVSEINNKFQKSVYCLDIYGKVDAAYEEEFGKLMAESGESIQYKGCVPPSDSVNIIKEYFMMLLPTKFKTEGFPGTAIDAFCAGVPIIASRWDSCSDIIADNYNGMIFAFCDFNDMKDKLIWAVNNINIINDMKANCVETAQKYMAQTVITRMLKEIHADEA